jgi:hypothetical protein
MLSPVRLYVAQSCIVEAKMTRKGLGQEEAANQQIEDNDRYREHPECGLKATSDKGLSLPAL